MESCRKICPIILALEYRKLEHQREIDELLPRSASAADELSKIEEDVSVFSIEDDPFLNARRGLNTSVIKAFETLNDISDRHIRRIDKLIENSIEECGRGPIYSGTGKLVLACGGVETTDAILRLRTKCD